MFEIASPWVFLLLGLPLILWFLIPRASSSLPAALQVPFYQSMRAIAEQDKHILSKKSGLGFWFLVWALLVLAAAGPRWVGEPLPLEREGRNIMMVLDLSGSMELNDMLMNGRPVSRLAVVKHAAEQFVKERAGDRIGLILFGSQAYLQTPLTYDRHSVLLRIEDATVGLAGKTTSIGDALGLAVKRLQDVPKSSRVVILLTDGANNSGVLLPLKAAELAKSEQIKVYTIGLGSEADPRMMSGPFINMGAGADLDEDTLKEIASITGGQYFRATDSSSLESIYQKINQLETVQQEHTTLRPQHEYYPWPLAFALALIMIWLLNSLGLFNYLLQRNTVYQEKGL
ncbi:VWA domain-containing protein [Legionella sp. 16cNR16C]|uniref:vWA domain-containing protein n=1 Tax=Legionella sp. 16cNR16C TaxID=2905656 RepID=UPI001E2D03B8|nr:VWA domain-containing protein [Legionella sp. 16cNR16C]MCE3045066.1 VWA domain-containing protein [Legionella sp. 16cNR16C]